jgi:hypothetical protein
MPATPVDVITWLDPPEQTDFAVGAAVTWHASFVDRITHALVSPTTVTFSTSNPPFTSTPVPTVVSPTSTGQYQMDFPIANPGGWLLLVQAQGTGSVAVGSASIKIWAFDEGL